jgi:hypothetical protein
VFLLVGGCVAAYVLEQRVKGFALGLAATGITTVSEELFKDLNMPQDEVKAAMAPVEAFAEKVRQGEVSIEQALAVGQAIGEGHVPPLVMARGFEAKHLTASGLSDEEKAAGHIATTRFAKGVASDAIAKGDREAVMEMLTERITTTGSGGQRHTKTQFKETLTDEELRGVIAKMKQLADDAGISDQAFQVDMAAEIEEAIQHGMDNPISAQ